MVEGRGTSMATGWARSPLCVRIFKDLDHDARESCKQGRCESPLMGGCKVELI